MKEVIIKVYTIDELAEEAKKYAIDNARCSVAECLNDADGWEYREALRKIEEALNIKVYDWEVDEYRHTSGSASTGIGMTRQTRNGCS